MNHLLCFGFGFSARTLAARLDRRQWTISATSRSPTGLAEIEKAGCRAIPFEAAKFDGVTHLLMSAPPDVEGDPVLRRYKAFPQFAWAGYLSTTGVYGDRGGAWVDEDSPLEPNTERGHRRVAAERQWLAALPVHIFRLAGIYGPGRNQLESVRDGTAKRIVKDGQVFSRIHVADIAGVLLASMAHPSPGRAYNVCDDEPAPPQDVVEYAARLLGKPVPPATAFEDAKLSPMAASFYADSKKVSNARIKTELGYTLLYPNYRAGLQALLPSPASAS